MDSEDNPAKLKTENRKLHKELRALVVEKNLMEHKLYRAFHKLLQTKKRKIRELERELKKLKGEDSDEVIEEDQSNHCQTCRCGSKSRKRRVICDDGEEVNGQEDENGGGGDNSDSDTDDPGYSDETDYDDEPASKSNSRTTSPSKTVVVRCHEPSGLDSMEVASTSDASSKPKVIEGTSGGTVIKNTSTTLQEPEVLPTSSAESSQDLDLLVDEFCA